MHPAGSFEFGREVDGFDGQGISRKKVGRAVVVRERRVPQEVMILEQRDGAFAELVQRSAVAAWSLAR
jgi:hypothetical protein